MIRPVSNRIVINGPVGERLFKRFINIRFIYAKFNDNVYDTIFVNDCLRKSLTKILLWPTGVAITKYYSLGNLKR